MVANNSDVAMNEAIQRLESFGRALEIKEKIKKSIYNFQAYNPLDDFYSRKNIFKFPKYLVNSSLRCRALLSELNIKDLDYLRYLKKMHFLALGYLRKNAREIGYKKAIEYVYWMQPFAPSNCSRLRYLMENVNIEDIFGNNPVNWVELFLVDACLVIEEAYCITEFIKKASKYPELAEDRLSLARRYKDEYSLLTAEALESTSFAEGLYYADKAKKLSISQNSQKAANKAHEKVKRFRVKCIALYEEKYSSFSNRKAAKSVFKELANDVDSPYGAMNIDGKDYSETLARWIAVWKKYKLCGGELYEFCSNSLKDAKAFIKTKGA